MAKSKWNRKIGIAAREMLIEKFPACFAAKGQPKRPLKVGIYQDIRERMPEVAGCRIARGINFYTDGPTYLDTLVEGADRIDLDGNPVDKVTAEAAQRAAWRALGIREARKAEGEIARMKEALGDAELSVEAVQACRRWADEGLGFNCTFVDDDMKVIVALAQRAVLAGLATDFSPDMQRRFSEHAERQREVHEGSLGRKIISDATGMRSND